MSVNLGSAFGEIRLDTGGLARGIKQAVDEIDRLEGSTKRGGLALSALGGAVAGLAFGAVQAGIGALGNAMGGLKDAVINTNATLESSKVSWGVLLGSAEAAEKQLQTLYRFGAETPFEFPEVEQASRLLQTFGGEALNTEKTLRLVGDIAAGTGQDFAGVAMWTGRMYDAIKSGRPFGEAAARLQEMGAMSGETRARLEQLQKEGADGAVIWAEFEQSMGRFGGMMDKQSRTFKGLASTLADTRTQLLATAGASTFAISTKALGGLVDLLSHPRAAQGAQAISDALGRLYQRLGQGFAALRQFAELVRGILGVRGAFDMTALERVTAAVATLRAEFRRAGGDLESAAGGMGSMIGAAGRVARVVDDAARGFQVFVDAIVTARQAWRGEWGAGGDESINGFVRAVGNASGLIAGGVEAIRARWLWLEAEIADAQDRITATVARWGPRLGAELARAGAAFDIFRAVVTDKLGGVRDFVGEWAGEVRDALQLLAGNTDAATPFARLDLALYSIGERLRSLAEFVRREAGPAFQFLKDNWLAVSLALGPLTLALGLVSPLLFGITSAVKLVSLAWGENWGDVQGKTATVVEWLQGTALPALQGFGDLFLGTVLPAVRVGWDGIAGAFRTAAEAIGPHLDTIKEVFGYLTGAEVAGGLEGLKGRFDEYATALGGLLGDLLGRAAAGLAELGRRFVEWVTPIIPPALEALGRFATRVVEFVSTVLLPAAAKALESFARAFWEWVAPAIPPLLVALKKLQDSLTDWAITTALPAIVKQLARWGVAFAGWVVTDAIPALLRELPKIPAAIVAWIATDLLPKAGTWLVETGHAIIAGLVQGLKEKVGDVTDFLSNLAKQIPGPIKKALKIESPSRVFRDEVGRPIVEGLIAGMAAMQPTLDRTVASLVNVPRLPRAERFAPVTTGGEVFRTASRGRSFGTPVAALAGRGPAPSVSITIPITFPGGVVIDNAQRLRELSDQIASEAREAAATGLLDALEERDRGGRVYGRPV